MNDSKKKELRFWERWRKAGAVEKIYPEKPPANQHVLAAPEVITIKAADGKIILLAKKFPGDDLLICDLIGTAVGMDVFHCIYIAARHTENFLKRVWCYTIKESEDKQYNVEVSFYELKKI